MNRGNVAGAGPARSEGWTEISWEAGYAGLIQHGRPQNRPYTSKSSRVALDKFFAALHATIFQEMRASFASAPPASYDAMAQGTSMDAEKIGIGTGIASAILGFMAGFKLIGVGLGLLLGTVAGIIGLATGYIVISAIKAFPSWFKEEGVYIVGGIVFWGAVILLWHVR